MEHLYSIVICRDCSKEWTMRRDAIKTWKGRCHSCASIKLAKSPRIKRLRSQNAKMQVLRQGGVPNARKFDGVNNSMEKHPRWKGGVTPENQRQRSSASAIEWRIAVFARDEFTCVVCGQVGGKLHAHHIKSWAEFPELRFEVGNGVTACKKCHKEILHQGSFHRKLFAVQGVA
jgi:5-methylcytosine-specific restriction endonuclease McrA